MSSILVINAAGRETRVALVENGHIAEFYLERKKDKGIVGNIYKGRVVRVLPGMQAAFVDIGLEKAAFLYVSDVVYDPDFARAEFELTEGEHDEAPEVPDMPDQADSSEHPEEADAHRAPELSLTDSQALLGSDLPSAEVEPEAQENPAGVLPTPGVGTAGEGLTDEAQGGFPGSLQLAEAAEVVPVAEAHTASAEAAPPASAEAAPPASTEAAPPASTEAAPPANAEASLAEGPSAEPPPPAPGTASTATLSPGEQGALPPGSTASPGDVPVPPTVLASPPVPDEQSGQRRTPRDAREQRARERDRGRRRDEQRGGRGGSDRDEERVKPRKVQRIEDLLKPGQEVVVQISKDPIGSKGARLTSHISIPGRHLVFMPTVNHVGISRRISNEKERRRLREIVDRLRPPGTGFIVRTVAENVPQEKLESDIRFLIGVWNEVVRRNEKRTNPGLLHPDLDLILRATRDLFAQDVEKLVVDERDEYERVLQFVVAQDPGLRDRVLLHDNDEPIFDAYGIEHELNRAVQRKVWLKSGGYLIIDQAEALTAIDVNSGRYVGKKSLEETITKINVEAAREIVYQLRLRNIGGIIICDFIDMEKPQNRDKVFKALQESLGRDKAKTNVLRISELGLVEMTRKRVRESIGRVLHEDCSYCDGKGFMKTATTVAYEIFREIRREAASYREPTLVINCHPEVARLLQGDERQELRHLMDRFNKSIQVRNQPGYHREQYDIYGRSAQGVDQRLHTVAAPPAYAAANAPMPPGGPPQGSGKAGHDRGGGHGGGRDRDRHHRGGGRGDRREDRGRHGGGQQDRHARHGGQGEDRGQRGPGGHGGPGNQGNQGGQDSEGHRTEAETQQGGNGGDPGQTPTPAPGPGQS